MRFNICPLGDHVRAELVERETAAETSTFLKAVVDACLEHGIDRVLLCVRASRPIFKVEQYEASAFLRALARRPASRVALVASRPDLRASHEYLEVLAGQQRANLRSFSNEALAVEWLREPAPAADREVREAAASKGS
jgi:hypothetical protein